MDINYDELFGLEPEEDPAGEEAPEVTDPAEDPEDVGEEDQDVADPDEADAGEEESEDADGDDDQDDQQTKSKPQTPEERRAQAAARRQREQQEAIDAAVRAERERNQAAWDAHYRAMGIRDPYHGNREVTTQAEYEAYLAARDEKNLERDLRSGKMTPEQFREQVNRQAQVQARQQAEQMQQQAAGRAEVERQFALLQKAEPTVKSLDDVMRDPVFVAAFAATKDMTKAYRMAHVDEIEARAKGAAAAGVAGDGKAHLRRAGTRGGGAPTITREMIEQYRIFDPDITVEEIRQFEAKYQKNRKK